MWRWLLGAILIGVSSLMGRTLAGTWVRRAEELCELMDGVHMLRIQMLEHLLPLGGAMEKTGHTLFQDAAARMNAQREKNAGQAMREAAQEMRKPGNRLDSLPEADLEAVCTLFADIGAITRSEQEVRFNTCIKRLGERESEARERAKDKTRLYMTVGALIGAAVVIAVL